MNILVQCIILNYPDIHLLGKTSLDPTMVPWWSSKGAWRTPWVAEIGWRNGGKIWRHLQAMES